MAMVAADTPSHPWALSKGESVCEDCSRFTTVIFSLQSKIGLHIALPSLLASVESPMESSRSFAVSTMRVWALPPASLVASFNRAFLRSPWCFFPWFWNNPLGLPVLLGFWIGVATTLGDFVLLKKIGPIVNEESMKLLPWGCIFHKSRKFGSSPPFSFHWASPFDSYYRSGTWRSLFVYSEPFRTLKSKIIGKEIENGSDPEILERLLSTTRPR